MTRQELITENESLKTKLEDEHRGGLAAYRLLCIHINFIKAILRDNGCVATIPHEEVKGELVCSDDIKAKTTTLRLEYKNE